MTYISINSDVRYVGHAELASLSGEKFAIITGKFYDITKFILIGTWEFAYPRT